MSKVRLTEESVAKIKQIEKDEAKKLLIKFISITVISVMILLISITIGFYCWLHFSTSDFLEFLIPGSVFYTLEGAFIYYIAEKLVKKNINETKKSIKRRKHIIKICNTDLDLV